MTRVITFLLVVFFIWNNCATADTPANCTIQDVIGEWIFYEGPMSETPNIDCDTLRKF